MRARCSLHCNAVQESDRKEKPKAFRRIVRAKPRDPRVFVALQSYDSVTRIANAPDFIKGVINLRGIIVPIVDMRIKFHLGRVDYDHQTVVIILNVAHRVVGMVVDGVSDVLTLSTEQIMPAPEFGGVLTTEYLTGLGTVDGRMLILMDIEKLMTSKEMALIETLGA